MPAKGTKMSEEEKAKLKLAIAIAKEAKRQKALARKVTDPAKKQVLIERLEKARAVKAANIANAKAAGTPIVKKIKPTVKDFYAIKKSEYNSLQKLNKSEINKYKVDEKALLNKLNLEIAENVKLYNKAIQQLKVLHKYKGKVKTLKVPLKYTSKLTMPKRKKYLVI